MRQQERASTYTTSSWRAIPFGRGSRGNAYVDIDVPSDTPSVYNTAQRDQPPEGQTDDPAMMRAISEAPVSSPTMPPMSSASMSTLQTPPSTLRRKPVPQLVDVAIPDSTLHHSSPPSPSHDVTHNPFTDPAYSDSDNSSLSTLSFRSTVSRSSTMHALSVVEEVSEPSEYEKSSRYRDSQSSHTNSSINFASPRHSADFRTFNSPADLKSQSFGGAVANAENPFSDPVSLSAGSTPNGSTHRFESSQLGPRFAALIEETRRE